MNTSLSEEFDFQTINLADDYEGKVTATLIAANSNTRKRRSVLYIHGWSDYFFHPHVATAFNEQGFDFYALELRKYGHSLLKHQHPNYCRSLEEYFEEISIALRQIHHKNNQPIILLGHSTGGLTTSLYMNSGAERALVSLLILNSPFLELNVSKLSRKILPLIARLGASLLPFSKVEHTVSPVYNQSLHKDFYGEWNFDKAWKPINHFPTYLSWLSAVVKAQSMLKHQSDIKVPTFVMHGSKSLIPKKYTKEAQTSDCVLNVDDILHIAPHLGKQITMVEIKDAVHDVFLSEEEVRNKAFDEMFGWLEKRSYEMVH
jgi:alpha-beta hydrolase superfamily lysophospholipase